MAPWLATALPSIIGGLFSAVNRPKLTPDQQQIRSVLMGNMNKLNTYGNSGVGNDPLENMQFANQLAGLGQQQNASRNNMMAQFNMNQGGGNAADFLSNLNSQQVAQRMAMQAQQMEGALNNRRQALMGASQMAQNMPNFTPPSSGMPDIFQQLGQMIAYQQQSKGQSNFFANLAKQQGAGGVPGSGVQGGVPVPGTTNSNYQIPTWGQNPQPRNPSSYGIG